MRNKRMLIIIIVVLLIIVATYSYKAFGNVKTYSYNKPTSALGFQLSNPGNIRKSNDVFDGEIPSPNSSFKAFKTMAHGYRALAIILYNYVTIYGSNTMSEIINRYAPPNENNTTSYIDFVKDFTGIGTEKVLSKKSFIGFLGLDPDMKEIIRAISAKEIGYIDEQQLSEGYLMFLKEKLI